MTASSKQRSFSLADAARDFVALVRYAWNRFQQDRCMRVAASLSYTTLLAVVPLLTIGFAMFAAFPAFQRVQKQVESFLFENLVYGADSAVQEQFQTFVANTGSLTAIGLLTLAVTALLMFATVENAFNVIWRVTDQRPLAIRFTMFWFILTAGPLLMGASVALSSYIFTVTRLLEIDSAFTGPAGRLLRLLPFLLQTAIFSALYFVLPNRRVRWRHAVIGGFVAAVLFELFKKGFALYIANFPSQETIYGALSAIPLFLVWMYVSWAAVLVGAEIVASLPEYKLTPEERNPEGVPLKERFTLSLAVLAMLTEASRQGERGRSLAYMMNQVDADEHAVNLVLQRLSEANYVAETADQSWLIARDLHSVRLFELYRDLGFDVALDDSDGAAAAAWHKRLAEIVDALDTARQDIMGQTLAELFAATGAEAGDDGAAAVEGRERIGDQRRSA